MRLFYSILALLIYVQSFALYGLRDYSCCGSHTKTEVAAKKSFTCCSHSKHSCETKLSTPKEDDHQSCSGDMCKCVSCHLSLVYLPLWQHHFENQSLSLPHQEDSFGIDGMHGNDYSRAQLQPPRFI